MTKKEQPDDGEERRIWSKIDLVKLSAGTLAAISSAVCASWLGVTGTIVGAALASVIATVGQELYAHSLKHTYQRLRGVRLEQALAAVGTTNRAGSSVRARVTTGPSTVTSGPVVDPSAPAMGRGGDTALMTDAPGDSGGSAGSGGANGSVRSGSGLPVGSGRPGDSALPGDSGVPGDSDVPGSADDRMTDGGRDSGDAAPSPAAARSGAARSDARDVDGDAGDHGRGRGAHWARLGLATAAMIVFAMLAIYAFELVAGDSLAGLLGDGSAGATTLPFMPGGGEPAPVFTPEPPVPTVPVDPTATAPAPADTPQPTAPAETPTAVDTAPASEPTLEPDPTTGPVTPPDTGEAPAGAGEAPAIEG